MEHTKSHRITVIGKITDPSYYRCLTCIQFLDKEYSNISVHTEVYHDTQWAEKLKQIANEKKGAFLSHKGSPLVWLDDRHYIGDCDSFMSYVLQEFRYLDKTNVIIYRKKASDAFKNAINSTPGRSYVHIDVVVDQHKHNIVIELFDEYCPKTCENFRKLCIGTKVGSKDLTYKQTEFTRVVKGMYIQGGNIKSLHSGAKDSDSFSSFEEGEFADESFHVKHGEIGLLGMCKRDGLKHTNQCQFYITTGAPLSFLDNKNVVFGRVIQGMRCIKMIDKMDLLFEAPVSSVKIDDAGIFKVEEKKLPAKKKE